MPIAQPKTHDLRTGDLAICIANGSRNLVGKAAMFEQPDQQRYVVGAFCARFRPERSESPDFVAALFESRPYRRWIHSVLAGTNINNLRPEDVTACPLVLPAAASVRQQLGRVIQKYHAVDRQILGLVDAKERQKRGLMQQLLTGRRRLAESTGRPWATRRFDEVMAIDPESLGNATHTDFVMRYIDLSAVNCGTIDMPTSSISFFNAPSRARRVVRKWDVLMSTVRPYLKGFALVEDEGRDLVASTGFAVLRTDSPGDALFVIAYLFSDLFGRQARARLVGSNYPALNSNDVRSLRIPWPEAEERARLGQIFSSLDRQVSAIKTLGNLLREQKRGLMQRLLTGAIGVDDSSFGDPTCG